MSSEGYKQLYDRDGFVVVRRFLSPGAFADLCLILERYISEVVPTLPTGEVIYADDKRPETLKQMNHLEKATVFREFVKRPEFFALGRALTGGEVTIKHPEWFCKPPTLSGPTPPHQDNYYLNMVPCDFGTIWIALDRVDQENGCLRYVIGSHKKGLRAHRVSSILGFSQTVADYSAEDEALETAICLDPGDAVAHHGLTIHRADANRSKIRNRRAFAVAFLGTEGQRDRKAYERYRAALKKQREALAFGAK